eukprot:UC1_evm1s1973
MAEVVATSTAKVAEAEDATTTQLVENEEEEESLPPYSASEGATHDEEEAPPSYESLSAQLRAAREQKEGVGFFLTALKILLTSVLGLVILAVYLGTLFGVAILFLVVGSNTMDSCPKDPRVPVMVVVYGAFMLAAGLISAHYSLWKHCLSDGADTTKAAYEEKYGSMASCDSWLKLANFISYIVLAVFIFEMTSPTPAECDHLLYYMSYWCLLLPWLICGGMVGLVIAIGILFCLFGMFSACICPKENNNTDGAESSSSAVSAHRERSGS